MDGYSRLVALLKVLLPLMALLLLSTLFILSRNVDPVATLPFADTEIVERLQGQQVTGPVFSGATDGGDMIMVSASRMSTRGGSKNNAEDFSAQIDLKSGAQILLSSDEGQFDLTSNVSQLVGNVVITTSTGYKVTSDALEADFDELALQSPGPVTGTGPIGTLNAGMLHLRRGTGDTNTHLIFTNGVKLVYTPQNTERE
ncbi:MAG: hypothetical protein ABJP79_05750 [Tateyamaria sp.]|uniref:hypothetical protein n=1 Tax=Tateyamaria sp. TaxID=1929288 RepID=UPI00329EB100